MLVAVTVDVRVMERLLLVVVEAVDVSVPVLDTETVRVAVTDRDALGVNDFVDELVVDHVTLTLCVLVSDCDKVMLLVTESVALFDRVDVSVSDADTVSVMLMLRDILRLRVDVDEIDTDDVSVTELDPVRLAVAEAVLVQLGLETDTVADIVRELVMVWVMETVTDCVTETVGDRVDVAVPVSVTVAVPVAVAEEE